MTLPAWECVGSRRGRMEPQKKGWELVQSLLEDEGTCQDMIANKAWVVMRQHWLIRVHDTTVAPVPWLLPQAVQLPFLHFGAGLSGWFHSAAVIGMKHCSVPKMSSLTAMQLFCMFDLHSGFSLSQSTAAPLLEESRGSWETWNLSLVPLLPPTKCDTEPLMLVGKTKNSSISSFCAFAHICPSVHSHLSSFCALSDHSTELASAARP